MAVTDPLVAENARNEPGVVYADDERGHFALLDLHQDGGGPEMRLRLMKDDGSTAFDRTFG